MNQDRIKELSHVTGEEFKPATAKLWTMLFVFATMVPAGAILAWCWWYQVVLPGGIVLKPKAGIFALLAIPLAIVLVVLMMALIATAKRLVIGENCVQLLSKDRVAVHIPFQNVAEIYTTGDKHVGTVVMILRKRDDPQTLVPSSTNDRYQIQCMIYGRSPGQVHQAVSQRLAKFRAAVG